MNILLRISSAIDSINEHIGKWAAWLTLIAVIICTVNAIVRYTVNMSSNAWLEMQWYLNAAMFLLVASYALKKNAHVRIDVIISKLSPRTQAWIDIVGALLFLIPVSLIIAWYSWPALVNSYDIGEMSSDPGGLIRWPMRLVIPVAFVAADSAGRVRDHQTRCLPQGPDPGSRRSPPSRGDRLMSHELMAPLMFGGLVIVLLIGYPVAFSLAANGLLFGFIGMEMGLLHPALLQALPERVLGIMANSTLLAIPFFTFMGLILERSGMAEELLETVGQLFGAIRGGIAYAVVFVGALLAATTGVVAASVIAMGLISLPVMMRYGYSQRLATGVIAASGTLAQIIPPSLVLIILADQLGASVGDLYEGALIPGLTLMGMYAGYVLIVSIFNPKAAPALPPEARTLKGTGACLAGGHLPDPAGSADLPGARHHFHRCRDADRRRGDGRIGRDHPRADEAQAQLRSDEAGH